MKRLLLLTCLVAISMCVPWNTRAADMHVPGEYPTIQEGVDAAAHGDTVLIADGTYTGNGNIDIDFKGKAISVSSENGPEQCTIDCQGLGRGFILTNNESNTSVINGLTVTNGLDDGLGGGAVYCSPAAPVVLNCRFVGNQSGNYGGAIRYMVIGNGLLDGDTLQVVHCLFENNQALRGGGIAVMGGSGALIYQCRVAGNTAAEMGGGIYLSATNGHIIDTVISSNTSDGDGGGIEYAHGYYPVINCLLTGNSASRGGAVSGDYGMEMMNCTVTGNSATDSGGAFFVTDMEPRITNCIVRENGLNPMVGFQDFERSTFSNLQYIMAEGEGCIDEDPLFVSGPYGEFFLSQGAAGQAATSPCLDTGSAPAANICFTVQAGQHCMEEFTTRTDYIGDYGTVDMGYHYSTDPAFPDCDFLECSIHIPVDSFAPGDIFYWNVIICNPTGMAFEDVWLYSILDVYGELFILPPSLFDVNPGLTVVVVVPPFTWPENAGTGQAILYSAMTDELVTSILGQFGFAAFSWTE